MGRLAILSMLVLLIQGCAGIPGPRDFAVASGRYAAAFDAARDTLISRRFELERIDARAGVITTRPKSTSGLATPWDTEQGSLDQEVEDFFNRQQRIVRITFEPSDPNPASIAPAASGSPTDPQHVEHEPDDLRAYSGPLNARVEVVIERLHRPGWQLEPGAIRHSSYAEDPALIDRGMWPTYAVPFSQDPDLAGRIAGEIEQRFKSPAPGATATAN
jgi:hypothetical protein